MRFSKIILLQFLFTSIANYVSASTSMVFVVWQKGMDPMDPKNQLHSTKITFANILAWEYYDEKTPRSPTAECNAIRAETLKKHHVTNPTELNNQILKYEFKLGNHGEEKKYELDVKMSEFRMTEAESHAFLSGSSQFRFEITPPKESAGNLIKLGRHEVELFQVATKSGKIKFHLEYNIDNAKTQLKFVVIEPVNSGFCEPEMAKNAFSVDWATCFDNNVATFYAELLRSVKIHIYYFAKFTINGHEGMLRRTVSFAKLSPEELEKLFVGGEAKIVLNGSDANARDSYKLEHVKGPSTSSRFGI